MEMNRIEELLRDPTLEQPTLTYHEVRLPWQSLLVRPEVAERVLEAVYGLHRTDWVRAETVTGSVVYIRTEHVVFVREWTPAQRASEQELSKALEEEWRAGQEEGAGGLEENLAGAVGPGASEEGGASKREEILGLLVLLMAVLGVAAVSASVTSWIWIARLVTP